MSKTVGMVPIYAPSAKRRRHVDFIACTACRGPMTTITAVLAGRVRTDALACVACGRLGVHCTCGVSA